MNIIEKPQHCKLSSCSTVEDFAKDIYFDNEYCSNTCRLIDKAKHREHKNSLRVNAISQLPRKTKFDRDNNEWAYDFLCQSELPKHLINLVANYYHSCVE